MTNPADANEVTAITTSPSPSNVYRSSDGGASWNKIGEIPSSYISDVSAFDFSTLYAITSSRCYRSLDGGASWTTASLPPSGGWAYDICAHPTDSSKVYASGYIYDYQIYPYTYSMVFFKSTDGGLNWSASSFFTFDSFYPSDMAISRSNPNVIYITGDKRVGSDSFGALFKTLDAGNTWTDISSSVDTERYNYFDSVAIDPTDESKIYIGGTYFYRSSRTGRGQELSWVRSSPRVSAYTIRIDPVEPSRIYVAGYQNISVSINYGQSWITRYDCIQNSGQHIEVAPADPAKVYVSSYAGFYKSQDFGTTWSTACESIYAARITAIAAAPSTVIVQNSGYLMEYGRGRTAEWRDVITPPSCGQVCDILINPEDSDTVLILEDYG
ncbi:MAG: WD40/YVTN/BNR-like repeat-containing protein [Planctomycetota bacterium]